MTNKKTAAKKEPAEKEPGPMAAVKAKTTQASAAIAPVAAVALLTPSDRAFHHLS